MSQNGQKKMMSDNQVVRQLKTVPLITHIQALPQLKPGFVTGNPAPSMGGQGQQQPWVRQTPDQIPVKRTMAKTSLTKKQQQDLKRLQAWQAKVALRQIKTVSPTIPNKATVAPTIKKKAPPPIQTPEIRTYYKNLRNEQRALKKAMKLKNKQANANVVPMTRYFQDPQPNEPDAMTSDMAPNMAWQEIEQPIPQLTNKQRKALYRLKQQEWREQQLASIPMPTGQYQAPHQNEPEDLTDDLAPSMAPNTAVKQEPGVQTGNKLNFKFQKPVQKTPNWSEYQNKFRQIGGGSPEPDGPPDNVKQEPVGNQSANTGVAAPAPAPVNPPAPAPIPAPAPALAAALAPAPAENNITLVGKQPRKKKTGVVQVDVRFPRPEAPAPAQPHAKPAHGSYKTTFEYGIPRSFLPVSNIQHPTPAACPIPGFEYTPAPAGIPRSFLRQEPQKIQEPNPPPVQHIPNPAGFEYTPAPAGIPRSFLRQEPQIIQEPNPPPVQHIPNPAELEYQAQSAVYSDLPSWIFPADAPQQIQPNQTVYENVQPTGGNAQVFPPMYRQQEPLPDRPYSPSEAYSENVRTEEEPREGSESPDLLQGQKRLSAFSRLGPLTQPKKPKLTINLMLNKEQAVREVVDETELVSRHVPVHLRKDILQSEDDLVKKYLPFWPWRKNMQLRKTVSARHSKTVMLWEQEQMEGGYEKENQFIQVVVKGYPKTWKKENVLDAVLECVKGKTFIPLFTEFTPQECKFLVIRCHAALVAIHKVGFYIRWNDVELTVSISLTDTGLNQIDLIPRIVLRKRLMLLYDGESRLDLTEFLAKSDVSHFVYFPLNRVTNQIELLQLQSDVAWEYLTELNLSRNRLTSIDGLNLRKSTPRLKRLDVSHNYLERLLALLPLRALPLRALRLEGNPLCHDYIDSAHYVRVVRMIFPEMRELDGVEITLKGELPPMRRNYCPWGAEGVVDSFLETFFPLLEAPRDDRAAIEHLYDKEAVMTITFRSKLRYGTLYRYYRNLFIRARSLEEREMESVVGAGSIATLIGKWPAIQHDRYTITVDVLHHDDFTTILRLGGILKLTAETLAEDEHLLTFGRTVVLHARRGAGGGGGHYTIRHEMLYWDVPREEQVTTAFNITTVRPRQLTLKLDSPPDDDLKSKLVDIFVHLADIDRKRGARCLELKNWDLRSALEYYVSLLKLDDVTVLSSAAKDRTPAPLAS